MWIIYCWINKYLHVFKDVVEVKAPGYEIVFIKLNIIILIICVFMSLDNIALHISEMLLFKRNIIYNVICFE